jgi:signal transduction histidine kinase
VLVAGTPEDGMVRFSVIDSGPGIAAEALPHLFDPYWSSKEHAKLGSGLGLFIASGIVAAHGGQLWVESEVGEGTAFHFTVPVAPR